MKLRTLILCCFAALPGVLAAQSTPVISQYMFNGMPLNPAVTGSRDALTFQVGHRSQWTGIEGAPVTQTFGLHTPLEHDHLAAGLLIFNDRLGVSRRLGVLVNAAYRLRLQSGVLSFGLAGGVVQHRHRWQDVVIQQEGDDAFAYGTEVVLRPEFSAGIYYYTNAYYFSLSSPMFMHSMAQKPVKEQGPGGLGVIQPSSVPIMVNAGIRMGISDDVFVTPSLMVRSYAGTLQLDVNMMALFMQRAELGVSYRSNDAVVLLGRFRATDQWNVGYAYDVAPGLLRRGTSGSHEVTLSYDCKYKTYTQNPRFF